MRLRGTGSIFRKQGTRFWQVSYYSIDGRQVQESSKSEKKSVAEAVLRDRLTKAEQGMPVAEMKKLSYEHMRASLLLDYETKGVKGLKKYKSGEPWGLAQHLDPFFKGMSARSINTDMLHRYIKDRKKKEDSANGTINRTLALLKRMMNIARRDGKLAFLPYFPMLSEAHNIRTGFVEDDVFEKLRKALPEKLHPLMLFLYTTGCRVGAAKAIGWSQIEDGDGKMYVRLEGVQTKNKEPLMLRLSTELAALLRDMPRKGHVFDGTNLRRAWDAATISIGLPDLLVHDLRRSGARNLRRAKVPESVIMKIGGWKTASMFRRYGIVSTDELDDAMDALEAKNGK
jgi:integrase